MATQLTAEQIKQYYASEGSKAKPLSPLNWLSAQTPGQISATDLVDMPNLNIDQTGTPENTANSLETIKQNSVSVLASATSQDEFLKAQQELLKEQQEELSKKSTEQQGWLDQAKTLISGKKSSQELLEEQMTKYEVPQNWEKIKSIIPEVNALNVSLANLETQEAQEVSNIELNPNFSVQYASKEQTRVSREYAIKKAGLSAQIGAKTAEMEAYQGNIDSARNIISDVVSAMTYDTDQKLQDINTFLDNNQNFINGLESDQKELLNDIQGYWKTKSETDKQDYQDKLNLIIDAANKGADLGIGVNDVQKMSLEEITSLYQQKVSTAVTEKTQGEQSSLGFSDAKIEASFREDGAALKLQVRAGGLTNDEAYNQLRDLYSPSEVTDQAIKDYLGMTETADTSNLTEEGIIENSKIEQDIERLSASGILQKSDIKIALKKRGYTDKEITASSVLSQDAAFINGAFELNCSNSILGIKAQASDLEISII